jgi:hypothetical protein
LCAAILQSSVGARRVRLARVFPYVLISVVIAPVGFGILAARGRQRSRAYVQLLALLCGYYILYMSVLYYLRYRWL